MDGDVENSGFKVSQGFGDLPSAAGHRAMTRNETGGDRSRFVSMTILCLFLLVGGIGVLVLAVSGGDDSNPRTAPLPPTPPPNVALAPAPAPSNVFVETNAPSTAVPVATETPTLIPTTFQPSTSTPTTFEESNFTSAPTEAPTTANTTAPTQFPTALNTTSPTLELNETQDANETAFPTTDSFNTTLAPTLSPLSDNNVTENTTSSENTTSLAPTLSPLGVKTIAPGLNVTEDDEGETNNLLPDMSAEPTASPTLNETDASHLETGMDPAIPNESSIPPSSAPAEI